MWVAPCADAAVLAIFVAIGRRSHDDGSDFAGFLRVLWPFAVGLVLGYAGTNLLRAPLVWKRVAIMAAVTIGVGETLRLTVQDRQWKPSFVIVAIIFIGGAMFAWRGLCVWQTSRRSRTH
jgi:hypothetical protein